VRTVQGVILIEGHGLAPLQFDMQGLCRGQRRFLSDAVVMANGSGIPSPPSP
jgi:hypothetical protein